MNDADKPFIAYRDGALSYRIVPRHAAGWRQTIIWMLLMVPVVGAFIAFANTEPKGAALYISLGLFTVAMAVWGIRGILWMRARAETVDIQELLAIKRERDAQKRRR
jgi:hypothetical protein